MSRSSFAKPQYPKTNKRGKKSNLMLETQPERQQVVRGDPDVKKKFTQHDINQVTPLTDNQLKSFQDFFSWCVDSY